jgi:hypothetical protein
MLQKLTVFLLWLYYVLFAILTIFSIYQLAYPKINQVGDSSGLQVLHQNYLINLFLYATYAFSFGIYLWILNSKRRSKSIQLISTALIASLPLSVFLFSSFSQFLRNLFNYSEFIKPHLDSVTMLLVFYLVLCILVFKNHENIKLI